nr:putative reverse transcriptase domain-containing protein [Tanacetum cinerariifolium]
APYQLALSKMKELLNQLQELSDKGFIRPSSSLWIEAMKPKNFEAEDMGGMIKKGKLNHPNKGEIRRIQPLGYGVKMEDPNITMEEYIKLEEEKARRNDQVYNWETATYGKI